ncbi:peptide chain release factor N(5)-glutamine methyltransferase [Pseudidiomarina mangrovi]|uniref:peptide chain release factor N(5)-glutamine methyltransferase n=1 Tax=Pseudidiomarina mangrovi TaxID=2487133 RepID=UPI000FCAB03C|nr:peptide chain release factor N(5)-glutamine methyltransferase [Pseudidiomarina mangrovi]
MTAALLSIAELIQQAQRRLWQSDSARLDSELLLAKVLDKPRSYLLTWPERAVSAAQQQAFEQLISAREQGQPVAYLLGQREFWSLTLEVNDSTLIPRPETEHLVEATLALDLPEQAQVADLGCGSGAIALALKSERPQWQVIGLERDAGAVALAQRNAERLQLDIKVLQSDWFSQLPAQQRFHAIVSNPPYIDANDPHLQQGDVRFEPRSALVAEQHGLADLAWLIAQAPQLLHHGGWLLLEHGWQQAEAVRQLFLQRGYQQVSSQRDYAKLERITLAQWVG